MPNSAPAQSRAELLAQLPVQLPVQLREEVRLHPVRGSVGFVPLREQRQTTMLRQSQQMCSLQGACKDSPW